MKNGLLILVTIFMTACGYQKSDEAPLKAEETSSPQAPQTVAPIAARPKTNFEKELTAFYNRYAEDVGRATNYDTRVNYQKAFEEIFVNKDSDIVEIYDNLAAHIATTNINEMSKNEKIAFYINAYNFLAIKAVLDFSKVEGQLIESITGPKGFAVFNDPEVFNANVAGELLTLDQIEKQRLNAELLNNCDARTHFAVICASEGCPILLRHPFTADLIEEQLDFVTTQGLKKERIFYTKEKSTFLTSLFDWYKDDYKCHSQRLHPNKSFPDFFSYTKQFIKDYSIPGTKVFNNIFYTEYDWNLNTTTGESE